MNELLRFKLRFPFWRGRQGRDDEKGDEDADNTEGLGDGEFADEGLIEPRYLEADEDEDDAEAACEETGEVHHAGEEEEKGEGKRRSGGARGGWADAAGTGEEGGCLFQWWSGFQN